MDIVCHHRILNSLQYPNRLFVEGLGGCVLCASLRKLLSRIVSNWVSRGAKGLCPDVHLTTCEVVLVRKAGDKICIYPGRT